ncbi:MAG: hypothetical protein V3W04_00360 [Gammaproteobacteria bacterium]
MEVNQNQIGQDAIEVVDRLGSCLEQFARTFEASAKRWELIVYPSMVAFIILAGYGFYLIYKLTNDVDAITQRVETMAINMINVDEYMSQIVVNMESMTESMKMMTTHIGNQREEMANFTHHLKTMNGSISTMNGSVGSMSNTIHQMRYDTSSMGRNLQNVTGPMRFMNSFMPW